MKPKYVVRIALKQDIIYADQIAYYIEQASHDLSNGICKRSKYLIEQKIISGDAVIAVGAGTKWLGFCYLHLWKDGFVSSCGLIVSPKYRQGNIAKQLKEKVLELAREKYPSAKYFGLTTSGAVMKINTQLRYRPFIYSEITRDENFWDSCKQCSNHPILNAKKNRNCLCTAMLVDHSLNA